MKKKFAAMVCFLALVVSCCVPAFARTRPSAELMTMQVTWGSDYAYGPTLYYRNNSKKTIKYIDWYVTAYNRVGDKIPGRATVKLTMVGPGIPFHVVRDVDYPLYSNWGAMDSSPFKFYKETGYYVSIGYNDVLKKVYQDAYGNFFVQPDGGDINSCTYLTEDEIQNAMFDTWCHFDDIGWRSNVISYVRADKAVVTYMDGSVETITNVESEYRGLILQNAPFAQQLAQYQDVYNYQDYLLLNPDLETVFETNQKALFEHFINCGMKEGRQGSRNFNLETYKANNPDLVAAFGSDNVKYYEHYISTGKAEGRIAS